MITTLIILGLASATFSVTVGSSKVFKSLRQRIAGRSNFFGDLVNCPYCLGHYAAAGLVIMTLGLDIIAWLAVTAISALASGSIVRLFND